MLNFCYLPEDRNYQKNIVVNQYELGRSRIIKFFVEVFWGLVVKILQLEMSLT